jgi:ribA/ribD-fused uncharacterized protein
MAINQFSGKYRFLSNFYPAPVRLPDEDYIYPTVEHAYQAVKTLRIEDRWVIKSCSTASEAKRCGRDSSLREDWKAVKVDVMRGLLLQKFALGTELAAKLLDTEDEELVEGNWWHDNFWGNCTCARCSDITGQNWLGRLLVEVRAALSEALRRGVLGRVRSRIVETREGSRADEDVAKQSNAGRTGGSIPPTGALLTVRCTMCNWSGMCPENEIDDACPGCGEYEALFEHDFEE